jgi:oleandomycin transport system permease protein
MTTLTVEPAPPAAPPVAKRHALVVAKRSLIKTWRTPEQLIDVTVQPIIFLLLFVYVFGGAISGGSRHEYLQYLLPGMLGQGVAMGSIALGQNLNTDIEKGVFDRFRSLPIGRLVPLLGAVWADFWVGMKARTSGAVQGIMFLLIFPLSFGSSTFVPVDSMPGWLQAFTNVNPITHLVGVVRGLMLGGPIANHLLWTLVWMAGLLALFVPLALRAYKRRV